MATKTERKPFHESVVDAIAKAKTPDVLNALGELITDTKIPRGHDAIFEAFRVKAMAFGGMVSEFVMSQTSRSLCEQAKEVEGDRRPEPGQAL